MYHQKDIQTERVDRFTFMLTRRNWRGNYKEKKKKKARADHYGVPTSSCYYCSTSNLQKYSTMDNDTAQVETEAYPLSNQVTL